MSKRLPSLSVDNTTKIEKLVHYGILISTIRIGTCINGNVI